MITLDEAIGKVWGFPPSTLTLKGLSGLAQDVMTMGVAGFLFVNYPHGLSNDLTIRWAGAVAMMLLMLYAFFPQMVRVLHGTYYEHYIENGEVEEPQ